MAGSFGKRAKALVIFSTGLLPTMASAQSSVADCTITQQISKTTSLVAELYQMDDGPIQRGYHIKMSPTKVKPNRKDLLTSPSALLSIWYNWDGARLVQESLEIRDPYSLPQGAIEPMYTVDLDFGGSKYQTTINGAVSEWATASVWKGGELLGTLKKDPSVSFRSSSDSQPTVFTYPRSDAKKAVDAAKGTFQKLDTQFAAGSCRSIQRYSSGTSGGTGSGSYCFLTTATCEIVGLDDDCWELRTLRRFRDDWLARQDDGMADIAMYYEKAPAIAARVRADRQAALRLYWTRIIPSALAAQFGANRLARAIYSKGMRELAAA